MNKTSFKMKMKILNHNGIIPEGAMEDFVSNFLIITYPYYQTLTDEELSSMMLSNAFDSVYNETRNLGG